MILVSAVGLTYAYFSIQVTGNEETSSLKVSTAVLRLIYTDTLRMEGRDIYPGWSQTKTITVENTGTVTVMYNLIWRELLNEITNNELFISATCASNIQGNTCSGINNQVISTITTEAENVQLKNGISIEPNEKHTYTVTVTFPELSTNQNYNQGKRFYGTLNIKEGTPTSAEWFRYTIENNEVTITGYKNGINADFEVVDVDACESTAAYILQQSPYYVSSSEATPAAQTLCDGGEFNSMTLADALYSGALGPEYYSALGVTFDATNAYYSPKDIIIPSEIEGKPVTTIGYLAFWDRNLTSVVIPDTVETIGESAFSQNPLTSIVIPEGVETIEYTAFWKNQLVSVIIPNSVETVGSYVFEGNNLESVVLPNQLTVISNGLFYNNNSLSYVTIPHSVTGIESWAFYNNQLASVSIPSSVTYIDSGAFSHNRLTSVVIPSNVSYVGSSAFANNQLTSIIIPSSVMEIDNNAFDSNQLTSVRINGKSSSSDFNYYSYYIWGWASGYSDSNIVWAGSGS